MSELQSAVEAIIYAAEEPATPAQIAAATGAELAAVTEAIAALTARYASDESGIEVRAVAGGYRMATKAQHHECVRQFLKNLKPPVRLSLAALETLAVIAYRQPVTLPEVREIRGVDPAGVINTLLDKKLVTTAGRKEVIGKPILYKTTREFLVQFGLSGLRDLPTLKEFEEMTQAGLEGLEGPEAPPDAGEATPASSIPAAVDPV
ncbi:MAG TPA: SMC-Scp complex subunit ScpB [Terriglobales bacterium]